MKIQKPPLRYRNTNMQLIRAFRPFSRAGNNFIVKYGGVISFSIHDIALQNLYHEIPETMVQSIAQYMGIEEYIGISLGDNNMKQGIE